MLALLSAAQFVDVLGVTIVVVALPSIQHDVGFSQEDVQWVVSIYALFFGGFLMLAGRAADLYGRRRLFMVGLAAFASASLLSGLAEAPAILLLARAMQGLGAATAVPAALSLLTTTFPEGVERNRALGVWTAAAAGGGAAGFFLGGVVTGALGWEWVFFVNVPVAVLSLALAPAVLPESRDPTAARRPDALGAVTVTAGLLLLIYAFTAAEDAGFASTPTVAALALSLALLVSFRLVEGRVADPLVPLDIFRSRQFVTANLVAFALTAVTSPASVLAAFYLQGVLGYSPTDAGLALLPFSLSVVSGSFAGSWLTSTIGARATMTSGLVAVGVAMLLLTRISPEGGVEYLLLGIVLSGFGLGGAAVASTAAGTAAAGAAERGLASGVLSTAAQLGTAVGIAALVTVAAARTGALAHGEDPLAPQLVDGFRLAFFVGAGAAFAGALATLFVASRASASR